MRPVLPAGLARAVHPAAGIGRGEREGGHGERNAGEGHGDWLGRWESCVNQDRVE